MRLAAANAARAADKRLAAEEEQAKNDETRPPDRSFVCLACGKVRTCDVEQKIGNELFIKYFIWLKAS